MSAVFVDTGPIVALLSRSETHHSWVRDVLDTVTMPAFTCEPVVTEACFLMRRFAGGPDAVLELIEDGVLVTDFQIVREHASVRKLMRRFADVPMSLADACLVRMTELAEDSAVLTLDGDFAVYRRNRRQVVPTIMPD